MPAAIIEHGTDSFVADTTAGIAANVRVKLTANGKIALAGVSEVEIGVTKTKSTDGTTPVEVRLANAPGSVWVTGGDAFARGAVVNRAANGKVVSAGAGSAYGIAAEASAADGDIVVVYPL